MKNLLFFWLLLYENCCSTCPLEKVLEWNNFGGEHFIIFPHYFVQNMYVKFCKFILAE